MSFCKSACMRACEWLKDQGMKSGEVEEFSKLGRHWIEPCLAHQEGPRRRCTPVQHRTSLPVSNSAFEGLSVMAI